MGNSEVFLESITLLEEGGVERSSARKLPTDRRRRLVVLTLTISMLGLVLVGSSDAYVRPGAMRQATVGWDGSQPDYPEIPCKSGNLCTYYLGHRSSLSGDGSLVAFSSYATNLVRDDTNGVGDVFARNLRTGRTIRVSVSSSGQQAVGIGPGNLTSTGFWDLSSRPSVSANGRYVAFDSEAPNLVLGDTNAGRDVFIHDLVNGTTLRASLNSKGEQARYPTDLRFTGSQSPAISANGRYVAFRSSATNLVPDDRNGYDDIFLHDMKTGKTQRVSVSSNEEEANNASNDDPSISANGRSVVFSSPSTNLVANDGSNGDDVFVRDVAAGKTVRASMSSAGQANLGSSLHETNHVISGNGRYVAFPSLANNLVPNDGNSGCSLLCDDVFVHDLKTRRTERVSVTSAGAEVKDGGSGVANVAISDDGRFVVFHSYSSELAGSEDAANACDEQLNANSCDSDVILHDLKTGATEWISSAPQGRDSVCKGKPAASFGLITLPLLTIGDCGAGDASVSANGRYVAFYGLLSNLVKNDNNDYADVFVKHRGASQGAGELERVRMSGASSFQSLGYVSESDAVDDATDLGGPAGSDIRSASIALQRKSKNLYFKLEVDRMPGLRGGIGGVPASGDPTVVYGFRFRVGGLDYELRAQRLAADVGSSGAPVFGLFRCATAGGCSHVADLEGGYGTIGDAVTFLVPMARVRLGSGGRLDGVTGFTELGTYDLGGGLPLDDMRIQRTPPR